MHYYNDLCSSHNYLKYHYLQGVQALKYNLDNPLADSWLLSVCPDLYHLLPGAGHMTKVDSPSGVLQENYYYL